MKVRTIDKRLRFGGDVLVRIVFMVLLLGVCRTFRTTSAMSLASDRDDSDCVVLRMILVFEDRPSEVTINLHTVAASNSMNQTLQYYWESYRPYSRVNVSTTTLLEEICVPKDECYLLQVVDNDKIGWNTNKTLSESATNSSRAFSISFDESVIGIYDSRIKNSCFSVQWYQFGYSCHDDATEKNDEEKIEDGDTESAIFSIYRGSLPCQSVSDAENVTEPDETILKGNNVTVSFSGPAINDEPTLSPSRESALTPSEISSASSEPSLIPTKMPSISSMPSLVPSAVVPDAVNIQPDTTLPPNMESDMPSLSISSSVFPSDLPSAFPSMVPTAKCIDFFVIVQLDDHPEDIMLTLTSTNEYGADDDVLIWDHLQPWNVSDGESDTFFAHQMVNQTTCIHEDECYTFIVEDMAQDGLTSMEQKSSAASDDNGEFPPMSGYFMLSYDSGRIISYYDGKVDGCYSKKIYKFGLSTDCANTETTEPSDSSCPQVRRRR